MLYFTHAIHLLSSLLQAHPPLAGVLLSLVVFFSAYQHFDVRDSKGGKFFQGLALLILALFGLNAVVSGMWLSLAIVAGTAFIEVWLARRQCRKTEKMTPS